MDGLILVMDRFPEPNPFRFLIKKLSGHGWSCEFDLVLEFVSGCRGIKHGQSIGGRMGLVFVFIHLSFEKARGLSSIVTGGSAPAPALLSKSFLTKLNSFEFEQKL